MGFYDDYNFDGLKLLSKLKEPGKNLSKPCKEFLNVIKHLKATTPPRSISVAEIGIGYGATALQVLKLLDAGDVYYAFDFEDRINDFVDDLKTRDFGVKCKVVGNGNSHLPWDSYNWNLSNMIFRMRERYESGMFDAVYLDGAHTFFHSGLAVCLLKELLKDGGFLILDDLFWTHAKSPTVKTVVDKYLPKNQLEDMQILRVQEIFLTNDPNFEKLSMPNAYRGVFRKRITK